MASSRSWSLEDKEVAARGDALEERGWIPRPVYLHRSSSIVLAHEWEDPCRPGSRFLVGQAEEIQRARDAEVSGVMES